MGQPKPLLDFDGETCISLVLSACAGSRADETVVVLGAEADRIRQSLASDGPARILVNDRHGRGQTSSVKAGMETVSARTDGFVLLPVDFPLVTSADIDALISRFEARPRGRTIFIAAHESRRGHPVLFAAAHRAAVLELGDDEPLSSYIRLREGEVDQVPVDNPGVVAPMNTPGEYEAVLKAYRGRSSRAQA